VRKLIAAKKPGDEVTIEVRRGKEVVKLRVLLGAVPIE